MTNGIKYHGAGSSVLRILGSPGGGLCKTSADFSRFKNLFRQLPLFGAKVAEKARREGVTIRTAAETADEMDMSWLRSKLVRALPQDAILPKKPGVVIDFGGYGADAAGGAKFLGMRSAAGERLAALMGNSKVREAAELPSLLPETFNLKQFAQARGISTRDPEALHKALKQHFKGRYLVKPDSSAASSADSLHTDLKGAKGLGAYVGRTPGKFAVQPRLDLEPMDRFGRMINHTSMAHWNGDLTLKNLLGVISSSKQQRGESSALWRAILGGKADFPMEFSLVGGKGREYRVHTLNGKVIPYATSERGTLRGLLPWHTRSAAKAERALQAKIDAMPAAERAKLQGGFGFDVMRGKGRDGGWHVIETNPSEIGGGSGFLSDHGHLQDAVGAAIQGRLPNYIKMQRGIQLGGGVGMAGLGISAMGGGHTPSPQLDQHARHTR